MKHYLTTEDWSRAELQALLDRARAFRDAPRGDALKDKAAAFVFFNNSLRTRASFQVGAGQLGGQSIIVEPGASGWPMEVAEGAVMDGEAEEHAKEAVRVLSRYVDLIGVRAFPKFADWAVDKAETTLKAFARWSEVPVINMETIVHPCQELALMMALQDKLDATDGRKFVLTWVPHPKPLNSAVANSALMIAAKFGFDVDVLIPDDVYRLDQRFVSDAEKSAQAQGRSVRFTTDVEDAYRGAHVVYAKSWGALPFYGRWAEEAPHRAMGADFMVDQRKMALTDDAVVSHCLPMRRNVKIADDVVDSPAFLGIEEAENRLHVQKAIMSALVESGS
ncbi:MAG: N-acetylornithine carbamoyltransferase [Maricaulaceae bacterium]|jgi:N-acetylornithine carbamoyltransferase